MTHIWGRALDAPPCQQPALSARGVALLLQDGQITEETQSLLEVVLPISDLKHVPQAVMQAHLLCRIQARLALFVDVFMFCNCWWPASSR